MEEYPASSPQVMNQTKIVTGHKCLNINSLRSQINLVCNPKYVRPIVPCHHNPTIDFKDRANKFLGVRPAQSF